jgi:tRNA G18 (ribose-2'-O)-methylase SpoU
LIIEHDFNRNLTRRQRYESKLSSAVTINASICTVNFGCDENLGYIIRSAACFGISTVHVIGAVPDRGFLSPVSGTLLDFVEIRQHASPGDFLRFSRDSCMHLVAAELVASSVSIYGYEFPIGHTCVIVGNERTGVPAEILHHSDVVHVPMPGVGFCLNTAQVGNIMLFELNRQLSMRSQNERLRAQ